MVTKRLRGVAPTTIVLMLAVIMSAMVLTPQFGAAEDDEEVKSSELPKSIRQALRDVEIEEVEQEKKDGATVFEVTIEADDVELELTLDDDGRLLGIEVEDKDGDEAGEDDHDDDKDEKDDKN